MRCKSSGSEASLELVSRCNSAASLYAAVLFLLYLIVYSVACPKRELLIAVSCELLFFVCLAAWRFMRSKSLDTRAKNAVVAQLTEDIRPLAAARSLYQYLFLGLWLVVCTLGTLDFAALCLAFSGNLKASEALYVNVPTMRLIGAHSAATAEILSGAYVNAGKYQQAEKLYGLVRDVRATVYGPASEPAVGLYADYGDLYALQKRYDLASTCYEKSIALSKTIHGATGYGRPLTGLANCLREQGSYQRAEIMYQDALKMRIRLYGPNSDKVSLTLKEYASLLNQIGRKQEASVLQERAAKIDLLHTKEDNNPLPLLCVMSVIFVFSYFLFGRKGFFTRIATSRLQLKVKNASQPRPDDVKRLAVLCKYQGLTMDMQPAEELMS